MAAIPKNTILVVDDNLGARKSIEALLANETYQIILADNGRDAIDLASIHSPDIILLDVMMPGMSGLEVCQIIRKDKRLSEIPIIMITALDDEDSMIQGIEAGADDFLPKPISKIELRSRVKGILRLNRFRKLCDERQKFELVVEQSNFGYIIVSKDLAIEFTNPAARELLEIPDNLDLASIDFPSLAERNYSVKPKAIREIFADRTDPRHSEPFIFVRSNLAGRNVRWLRAFVRDLGASSNSQTLIKLEDITEQIVSFQEKHTFSRLISHKLLTPLNALKASSQIMDGLDDGKIQELGMTKVIDLQKEGISRLEYDIRSVLAFLESSNYTPGQEQRSSVVETIEHLRQFTETGGYQFEYECVGAIAENTRIGLSLNSFEACVREIVENAIKFTENGPTKIQCRIEKITTDGQPFIAYRFGNNSKPLSATELTNAWKPYWQADRYYTGEIRGMGLGLSLIATNVWSAGGTCKIQNREDTTGVELTFILPAL